MKSPYLDGAPIAKPRNLPRRINIDASLLSKKGNQVAQVEMVQMQNGCICCTLRDEFMAEIERLSGNQNIEAIFVEASGISEPSSIAGAFLNYEEMTEDTRGMMSRNSGTYLFAE